MADPAIRVRLDAALLGRIDAHRAWIEQQVPGLMLTRSDAIRQLLRQALQSGEEGRGAARSQASSSPASPRPPVSPAQGEASVAGRGSGEDEERGHTAAELASMTRSFLARNGRNQAWLAGVLGTSRQQVSRWLSGERPPGARWTRALYEVTGVDWARRRPDHGDRKAVDPQRFPEALRSWRAAMGWSQRDLAEALDSSQRVVSGWENGHASPQRRNLERLGELGFRPPVL